MRMATYLWRRYAAGGARRLAAYITTSSASGGVRRCRRAAPGIRRDISISCVAAVVLRTRRDGVASTVNGGTFLLHLSAFFGAARTHHHVFYATALVRRRAAQRARHHQCFGGWLCIARIAPSAARRGDVVFCRLGGDSARWACFAALVARARIIRHGARRARRAHRMWRGAHHLLI